MIYNLPHWIPLTFIAALVATIVLFHFSNGKPKKITLWISIWSILQCALAYLGFYQITDSIPPRFGLVLVPVTMFIIYGLLPKQQHWFIQHRKSQLSTVLHTVRLPVEIVLFGLFTHKMVPELMTFEGRNYDILMGITAPIIAWLFRKQKIPKKILLAWNGVGLVHRAVNYFPFVLLPATIVPIVIWTHISDIIILLKAIKNS